MPADLELVKEYLAIGEKKARRMRHIDRAELYKDTLFNIAELEAENATLRKALEVGRNLANRVSESNALDCTVHGHYEIEEAEWLAIEQAHSEYLEVVLKGQRAREATGGK